MRISDWSSDVCSSDLQKLGIGFRNRNADHAMLVENLRQWQAGIDEEMPGAGVEPGEIARVEHDPRRIGVAPLDPYTMNIGLHLPYLQLLPPSGRITGSQKIGRASCRARVCQYV